MCRLMDTKFYRCSELGNRYIDLEREILGLTLFKSADILDNMCHGADLIFHSPNGDISVITRIRTAEYIKYRYDFTLRCHRNSGTDTEFQKIMGTCEDAKEYGNYLFYGIENESGDDLAEWFIGDFDVFRKEIKGKLKFKRMNQKDSKLGDLILNGEKVGCSQRVHKFDRDTGEPYYDYFYAIDRRKIPGFVIACKEDFDDQ